MLLTIERNKVDAFCQSITNFDKESASLNFNNSCYQIDEKLKPVNKNRLIMSSVLKDRSIINIPKFSRCSLDDPQIMVKGTHTPREPVRKPIQRHKGKLVLIIRNRK